MNKKREIARALTHLRAEPTDRDIREMDLMRYHASPVAKHQMYFLVNLSSDY